MGEVDGQCRLILHLWCFEFSRKDVSLWTRCLVDGVKS